MTVRRVPPGAIPVRVPRPLSLDEQEQVDRINLRRGMAKLEATFSKPPSAGKTKQQRAVHNNGWTT